MNKLYLPVVFSVFYIQSSLAFTSNVWNRTLSVATELWWSLSEDIVSFSPTLAIYPELYRHLDIAEAHTFSHNF